MGYAKGTQEATEKAPSSQSWNNYSTKIKYYWIITQINIHAYILIQILIH